MATTTKATSLKSAPTKNTTTTPTSTNTAKLEAEVATLTAQVEALTAHVTNLNAAVSGGAKDTDGDGIPDVAGVTVRLNNVVNFLARKFGQGPMEQNNIY